jgi:hypothetical protein
VRDFLDQFGPEDDSGSRVFVNCNNQTHQYRVPVNFFADGKPCSLLIPEFRYANPPGIKTAIKDLACDPLLRSSNVQFSSGGLLYSLLNHPTFIIVAAKDTNLLSPTVKVLDLDPPLSEFLSRLYYEAENVVFGAISPIFCNFLKHTLEQHSRKTKLLITKRDGSREKRDFF